MNEADEEVLMFWRCWL